MPLANGGRDQGRRQRLAELVSIVTQQLAAAVQNSDLDIVLYHLGDANPVAEPNVQLAADHILPEELGDRPRLAAPLLDLFQPDQVSFVLLVTNSPVHDLDDVAHGDWRARLYLYRDIDRMRWSHPLREIVVKSTDPRRSLPDVTRVADAIVETSDLNSEERNAMPQVICPFCLQPHDFRISSSVTKLARKCPRSISKTTPKHRRSGS